MSIRESAQFRREARLRRAKRVRNRVIGTADKPRLSVHRSNRHVTAQLIDDEAKAFLNNNLDQYIDVLSRTLPDCRHFLQEMIQSHAHDRAYRFASIPWHSMCIAV